VVPWGTHMERMQPVGRTHAGPGFPKDCTLWEGPTLERFVEDSLLWEGPQAGAGAECEESFL